jgi:Flp pilus assembly protein TadD
MRQHRLGRGERLDSWKAIATLLGRTVRTVQRWERDEHLPVYRHVHHNGATVYAYSADLEDWLAAQSFHETKTPGEYPGVEQAQIDYLRGCDALRKRTPASVRRAIEAFEASVTKDPSWPPAHAAIAEAYVIVSVHEWSPPLESFPKVRTAANAALALDSRSAAAHAALGIVAAWFEADWQVSAGHFERALTLDHQSSIAHYWHGMVLLNQGRFAHAISELQTAAALDPGSPTIVANLGRPYLCAGDYKTAAKYFQLARELHPTLWLADVFLGWALEADGRLDEALCCFESAVAQSARTPVATTSLAYARGRRGLKEGAETLLDELTSGRCSNFVPPVRVARAYVGLEQFDRAFEWLDLARETQSLSNNVYLPFDPAFQPIAADPRFRSIVKSLNL